MSNLLFNCNEKVLAVYFFITVVTTTVRTMTRFETPLPR